MNADKLIVAATGLINAWDEIAKTGSELASAKHELYIDMMRDALGELNDCDTPLLKQHSDNAIQTKQNYENSAGEIERYCL